MDFPSAQKGANFRQNCLWRMRQEAHRLYFRQEQEDMTKIPRDKCEHRVNLAEMCESVTYTTGENDLWYV